MNLERNPPISNSEINVLRRASKHPDEVIKKAGSEAVVGSVTFPGGAGSVGPLLQKQAIEPHPPAMAGEYKITERGIDLAKRYGGSS